MEIWQAWLFFAACVVASGLALAGPRGRSVALVAAQACAVVLLPVLGGAGLLIVTWNGPLGAWLGLRLMPPGVAVIFAALALVGLAVVRALR